MKRSIYFSLILSFLFSIPCSGQSFHLELPYDTVYLGNTIAISFVAKNIDGTIEVELGNLPVVSGPNQSSSRMMMNGNVESSTTLSYVLRPIEVGYLEIPSAYLTNADSVMETTPVSVLVLDNPDNIVQYEESRKRDLFFGEDIFRNAEPIKKPNTKKRKLKKI